MARAPGLYSSLRFHKEQQARMLCFAGCFASFGRSLQMRPLGGFIPHSPAAMSPPITQLHSSPQKASDGHDLMKFLIISKRRRNKLNNIQVYILLECFMNLVVFSKPEQSVQSIQCFYGFNSSLTQLYKFCLEWWEWEYSIYKYLLKEFPPEKEMKFWRLGRSGQQSGPSQMLSYL